MTVIIGMDPHKRSATIEVVDGKGAVLAAGRFGTGKAGCGLMLAAGRRFGDRIWAVEGCNGIGRHIAHRLVHDGEVVLDVPPKLSAQVRVFATGNGRKTDPVDAHSVAMVALRSEGLVRVQADDDLLVMGMLADRRDELGRATAPLDVSSGSQERHRLSRAGDRRINRALHIMAVVQLRNQTQGRAYYGARKAGGMPSMMAMRALKRRLSNVVFTRMLADQKRREEAGPGGQPGTTTDSSVTDLTPDIGSSDKPHPGPATHLRPAARAAS